MKVVVSILAIVFVLSACTSSHVPAHVLPEKGNVIDIIDGDTYIIAVDGEKERVRALGIDYPDMTKEKMQTFLDLGVSKKKLEMCYEQGKKEVEALLKGVNVTLVSDKREQERDEYGRLLRYVDVGKGDMETWLLEKGYARFYDPTSPWCERCKKYKELYAKIREAKKGCLW